MARTAAILAKRERKRLASLEVIGATHNKPSKDGQDLEELQVTNAADSPSPEANFNLALVGPVPPIISQLRLSNGQKPAVDLPWEILVRIFEILCLSGINELLTRSNADVEDKIRRHRFTVSSTCHRWREVALNTSSLWSQIPIRFTPHRYEDIFSIEPGMPNPVPSFEFTSIAIARARLRPLSLYVDLVEDTTESELYERDVAYANTMIAPLLGRCESLRLRIWIHYIMVPMSDVFRGKIAVPNLRFVCLTIMGDMAYRSDSAMDLSLAHHLEELRLTIHTAATGLLILPPPKQNKIRRLQLRGRFPLVSVASALQSALELKTLEWSDTTQEYVDNTMAPAASVTLVGLRNLRVCGSGPFQFVSGIIAPDLSYLHIDTSRSHCTLAHWLSKLARYPKLRKLFIESSLDETPIDLILPFIRGHQHLKHLAISNPGVEVFRLLYELFSATDFTSITLDISTWVGHDVEIGKDILREVLNRKIMAHPTRPIEIKLINSNLPSHFELLLNEEFPGLFNISRDGNDDFGTFWT